MRKLGLRPNMGMRANIRIDPVAIFNSISPTGSSAGSLAEVLSSLILASNPNINVSQVADTLAANIATVNLTGIPQTVNVTFGNTTFTFNPWQAAGLTPGSLDQGLVDLSQNLEALGPNATLTDLLNLLINNNTVPDSLVVYDQQYNLVDSIEDPAGKYPALLGNVVVLERQYFEQALQGYLSALLANPLIAAILPQLGVNATEFINSASTLRINDYAMSIIGIFQDRFDLYVQSTTDRQTELIQITDNISLALGLDYPASWTTPVESGVETTTYISLFLNEIFFSVIGVLCILAVMLIYSLLLSDVEEKTFEYGMLRMLGMPKVVLIALLCFQALYFAVPGIVVGFVICFILYIPIEFAISYFVITSMQAEIQSGAIALGLVLGICLPFLGMARTLSIFFIIVIIIFHLNFFFCFLLVAAHQKGPEPDIEGRPGHLPQHRV